VDPNGERNRVGCTDYVYGKISEINPVDLQIKVDGVLVQVTEDTVIMKYKVPIAFEDLVVGMTVCAKGEYVDDVLVAAKINVMKDCGQGCAEIQGVIKSIDPVAMQIVVDDVTVQVTADTVIKQKCQVIKFEDLEIGMTVCIKGEYKDDILYAKVIAVCGGCGGGGGGGCR